MTRPYVVKSASMCEKSMTLSKHSDTKLIMVIELSGVQFGLKSYA